MGERKVLNKYIPADFDPSLVPKGKKLSSKDGTVPVRMMLPFSIQCGNCNTFLYRGRKFNSKKEAMGGPSGTYLGITRWRFYIKCTHCSRPLTFLTDPANADYEMESGGTRNYEMNKDKKSTEEESEVDREKEEKMDPMKALENRVLESQSEMAEMDQLEEIKAMNARHLKLMHGAPHLDEATKEMLLGKDPNSKDDDEGNLLTAEDEALVKSIQFGKKRYNNSNKNSTKPAADGSINNNNSEIIKRLDEDDEQRLEEMRHTQIADFAAKQQQQQNGTLSLLSKKAPPPVLFSVVAKRRRVPQEGTSDAAAAAAAAAKKPDLGSLLGGYGSSSSSNDEES
jgi:Saf4/Yju2 protein